MAPGIRILILDCGAVAKCLRAGIEGMEKPISGWVRRAGAERRWGSMPRICMGRRHGALMGGCGGPGGRAEGWGTEEELREGWGDPVPGNNLLPPPPQYCFLSIQTSF